MHLKTALNNILSAYQDFLQLQSQKDLLTSAEHKYKELNNILDQKRCVLGRNLVEIHKYFVRNRWDELDDETFKKNLISFLKPQGFAISQINAISNFHRKLIQQMDELAKNMNDVELPLFFKMDRIIDFFIEKDDRIMSRLSDPEKVKAENLLDIFKKIKSRRFKTVRYLLKKRPTLLPKLLSSTSTFSEIYIHLTREQINALENHNIMTYYRSLNMQKDLIQSTLSTYEKKDNSFSIQSLHGSRLGRAMAYMQLSIALMTAIMPACSSKDENQGFTTEIVEDNIPKYDIVIQKVIREISSLEPGLSDLERAVMQRHLKNISDRKPSALEDIDYFIKLYSALMDPYFRSSISDRIYSIEGIMTSENFHPNDKLTKSTILRLALYQKNNLKDTTFYDFYPANKNMSKELKSVDFLIANFLKMDRDQMRDYKSAEDILSVIEKLRDFSRRLNQDEWGYESDLSTLIIYWANGIDLLKASDRWDLEEKDKTQLLFNAGKYEALVFSDDFKNWQGYMRKALQTHGRKGYISFSLYLYLSGSENPYSHRAAKIVDRTITDLSEIYTRTFPYSVVKLMTRPKAGVSFPPPGDILPVPGQKYIPSKKIGLLNSENTSLWKDLRSVTSLVSDPETAEELIDLLGLFHEVEIEHDLSFDRFLEDIELIVKINTSNGSTSKYTVTSIQAYTHITKRFRNKHDQAELSRFLKLTDKPYELLALLNTILMNLNRQAEYWSHIPQDLQTFSKYKRWRSISYGPQSLEFLITFLRNIQADDTGKKHVADFIIEKISVPNKKREILEFLHITHNAHIDIRSHLRNHVLNLLQDKQLSIISPTESADDKINEALMDISILIQIAESEDKKIRIVDEFKPLLSRMKGSVEIENIIAIAKYFPHILDLVEIKDYSDIELLRIKINNTYRNRTGDELIFAYLENNITRKIEKGVPKDQLRFMNDFIYLIYNVKDRDVRETYETYFGFYIADLIEKSKNNSVLYKGLMKRHEQLLKLGVDPEIEPWWKKLFRKNIRYNLVRGSQKIESEWHDEVLRKEILESSPGQQRNIAIRPPGQVLFMRIGDITLTSVNVPIDSSQTHILSRPGQGISESLVHKTFGDRIIAQTVGTYTTGNKIPTDWIIINGKQQNHLFTSKEGLLIIDSEGRPKIINKNSFSKKEIDPSEPDEIIGITNIRRLRWLREKLIQQKKSLLQTHLLIQDGRLLVGKNSKTDRAVRRLFALNSEGKVMIVGFDEPLTLAEAAMLCKKAGAVAALNLDTGYYDYSSFYYPDGRQEIIGIGDKDGASNKIIITTL